MRTLLWFLYSIHYINSKTSVHTIMDDTLFYYPWYDLSWRNSFSMGEIETLRLWVSCLNYFGLLELWWQCKHINWNTNLKTFGDAPWSCLAGLLVRTLLSQEIFVVSVVDLILNSKCDHTPNANNSLLWDRGYLSRRAFLWLGEVVGHESRIGTPPNTT